jgi:hypothetical protein
VSSAVAAAAASQESEFSEVDVESTALTDQRKPDAEPKERFRLLKGIHNSNKHPPAKGTSVI